MRYFAIIFTIFFVFSCNKQETPITPKTATGNIETVHTGTKVDIPLSEKSTNEEKEFQSDLNNLLNSVEKDTHE